MTRISAAPLPARREFMTSEASLRELRCAEALYPEGLVLRPHLHDRPTVTVVAGGSLLELQGRRELPVECAPGTAVVRPAGEPHGNRVGRGGVVNLELEIDPALLARHDVVVATPAVVSPGWLAGAASRLRRALESPDATAALLVEGLALEILALALDRAAAPRRAAPPWLRRVDERVRAEFRSDLTLSALAREAGVHPVHLARVFRERHGCSVGERVRALRLEWAAARLASTATPIAGVALDAGFHDQSHLTRAFREAFGITPARYRRRGAR